MKYDDRKREAGTNPDEWIEGEPLNGDRLADEAADTEGHMPRVKFGVQPPRTSRSTGADEPAIEPDEAGRFRG